jgi:hypothetical protein
MAKLTGKELLAALAQINKHAEDFKNLWQGYLSTIPLPPETEIKNAVRRLALQDLVDGMESYAVVIAKAENMELTSKDAMNYICGTAWRILEKENPDQKFHPTARRQRIAQETVNQ